MLARCGPLKLAVVPAHRIFLLSPAKAGGVRYSMLVRPEANFELAEKLRQGTATLAEVYSFISGLYFRGKIAYLNAFGVSPSRIPSGLVIVPGAGLVPPETTIDIQQLQTIATIPVAQANHTYRTALLSAARLLDDATGGRCSYVLLGSVASAKYTEPLLEVFGDRLLFPAEFVGRGDMSRGGLMLRCAHSGTELQYVPVRGALLRGSRPPKLEPWRKR
jgi:hypothetical protein